jgi:hypothetical protein
MVSPVTQRAGNRNQKNRCIILKRDAHGRNARI